MVFHFLLSGLPALWDHPTFPFGTSTHGLYVWVSPQNPFSPSWVFHGVSSILAGLSWGPGPFAFSCREAVRCLSIWVRTCPPWQVSGLQA